MKAKTTKPQAKQAQLKIRIKTRAKYEEIAALKRWTLAETADALADHFLAQHRHDPSHN